MEQKSHEQKQHALLFWAIQLQKKVFVHWLIYLSERKRKKLRYNQATQQRHDELVRDCLRQFLVYTDHTKQRRQALFIHQQVYVIKQWFFSKKQTSFFFFGIFSCIMIEMH